MRCVYGAVAERPDLKYAPTLLQVFILRVCMNSPGEGKFYCRRM
jgi:hypothetical protein